MFLSATKSTPVVDFAPDNLPVLRMAGPCFPMPAPAFFDRVIEGDAANRDKVPGLRAILQGYSGNGRLRFVFDLRLINSRSVKEPDKPLLFLLDLLGTYDVEIVWIRHPDDESNIQAGGLLKERYPGIFTIV